MWIHNSAWAPWIDFFRAAGFEVHAPPWPGEAPTVAEARRNPSGRMGYGAVTRHYVQFVDRMEEEPIVIGHSVGGHVAMRLHAMGLSRATVAIAPMQFRGVRRLPLSQLQAIVPFLRNPANYSRALALSRTQFHRAFASELSRVESDAIYDRWAIPSPVRPLFQTAFANLNPRSKAQVHTHTRGRPLLIVAGERDRLVPISVAREEALRYERRPAFTILPGRGHSLVVDAGWRRVAEVILGWLARQELAPVFPERRPGMPTHPEPEPEAGRT